MSSTCIRASTPKRVRLRARAVWIVCVGEVLLQTIFGSRAPQNDGDPQGVPLQQCPDLGRRAPPTAHTNRPTPQSAASHNHPTPEPPRRTPPPRNAELRAPYPPPIPTRPIVPPAGES